MINHSFQQNRTIKGLMAEAGIPAMPPVDFHGRRIAVGDTVHEYTNGRIGPELAGMAVGDFTVVRVDKAAGVLFTDRYAKQGRPETAAYPNDVEVRNL
jgi:hypothetical protein